jgi:DNA-binding Lrp family transcriptional regulator
MPQEAIMTSAYVFIQVGMGGNAQKIHDDLHAIAGVKSVHYVWGPIDCVLFADAPDMAGLVNLTGKIRAMPGIASVDTRVVLSM